MIDEINLAIVLIIGMILCSLPFIAGYLYVKNTIPVRTVHAGSGDKHSFKDDKTNIRISPLETFYSNGKKVNPKKYDVRLVEGDCMAAKGFESRNIIFVQRFKAGENKKIVPGDILFIKKVKDGREFYKIREFHHLDDEGRAITCYYKDDTLEWSSSPHGMETIEGVVKMRFKYKF
jgi:hypothetical protein